MPKPSKRKAEPGWHDTLWEVRACLKKAFRELRVPVCGRFYPNEGGVAGYGNRIRVKSPAKGGLQIAEMIFQTRSRASFKIRRLRRLSRGAAAPREL
ncbi:hypothetical protein DW266_03200 [Blautia sp. AM22-22LB]|nr:hypothetical protein DW266_03200 [Blautia sp. AM22-22LB]